MFRKFFLLLREVVQFNENLVRICFEIVQRSDIFGTWVRRKRSIEREPANGGDKLKGRIGLNAMVVVSTNTIPSQV